MLKLNCHPSTSDLTSKSIILSWIRFDIGIKYTLITFLQLISIRICSIPPKWAVRGYLESCAVLVAFMQQRTNRLYVYCPWYGVSVECLQTQICYIDTPRCRIAYVGCHNFGNNLPTEVSAASEQVLFINVHVITTSTGVVTVILRFFVGIFFFFFLFFFFFFCFIWPVHCVFIYPCFMLILISLSLRQWPLNSILEEYLSKISCWHVHTLRVFIFYFRPLLHFCHSNAYACWRSGKGCYEQYTLCFLSLWKM